MDDDEIASMARELTAVVGYIDQLGELNTDDVPEMAHAIEVHSVFREDDIKPSFQTNESLRNAPRREGEFFQVPKVLDGGDAV